MIGEDSGLYGRLKKRFDWIKIFPDFSHKLNNVIKYGLKKAPLLGKHIVEQI